MKLSLSRSKIYFYFLLSLLVFFYYCHGDAYFIIWKKVKSIYIFLFVIVLSAVLLINKKTIQEFLKNQLIMYVVLLLLIYIIYLPYSYFFGFLDLTFFKEQILTLLILVLIAFVLSSKSNVLMILKILPFGVILSVIMNLYDITHVSSYYNMNDPLTRSSFSMIYGRAAGFYIDPNVSAIAILLGLILTINQVRKKYKFVYLILCGIGVAVTLSLAGMLAFLVFIYLEFIHKKIKVKYLLIFVFAFLISSFSVRYVINNDIIHVGPGLKKRIDVIVNPFSGGKNTGSTKGRLVLLKNSAEVFFENPFTGNGIGRHQHIVTGEDEKSRAGTHAGPHNQWLAFMIDFGILGIPIFLLLFLILYPKNKTPYRKEVINFIIIFFIYSLFSHTVFKNHSLMFLLPLVYKISKFKPNNDRQDL